MFDAEEIPNTTVLVEQILFSKPDDAFAVVRVRPESGAEAFVAAGPLPLGITEGDALRLEGAFEEHPRFGRRFKVRNAHPERPLSEEGIRRYLRGGRIRGIGPKLADRIVDRFGAETLEVLEREPERLQEIEGVGAGRMQSILGADRDGRALREALVTLQGLGLGPYQSQELVTELGEHEVLATLSRDPYGLVGRLPRFGFKTADQIAQGLGLDAIAPARLRAALVHHMSEAAQQGHLYSSADDLIHKVSERLDVAAELVRQALQQSVKDERLVALRPDLPPFADPSPVAVALPATMAEEEEAARAIIGLFEATSPALLEPPARLDPPGLDLSREQREAVHEVLRARVALLTGGPGVGKTTVLKAIVQAWEGQGLTVSLCAPTGRAARRLHEATGRDANTLHRTFGIRPGMREHGTPSVLDADALVIDEASMLDLPLFASVLRRLKPGTLLLLVGDPDQLPSVGPGNVLDDLIESRRIPVVRLKTVFRQAMGSWIVRNAHRVLRGELPVFPPRGETADCYFAERDTGTEGARVLMSLVTQRIPERFGFDPRRDVQVLSPMHRGPAGVQALNRELQAALASGSGIKTPHGFLRVGDRVMQVRNDHDRDLTNGEIGWVETASQEGAVATVRFEGREVRYEGAELADLTLAWAVTVHKSQGAEFPVVVMTLFREHHLMLRRAILYTAMTRARKLLVLVGSRSALEAAVKDARAFPRRSTLRPRLMGLRMLAVPPEEL